MIEEQENGVQEDPSMLGALAKGADTIVGSERKGSLYGWCLGASAVATIVFSYLPGLRVLSLLPRDVREKWQDELLHLYMYVGLPLVFLIIFFVTWHLMTFLRRHRMLDGIGLLLFDQVSTEREAYVVGGAFFVSLLGTIASFFTWMWRLYMNIPAEVRRQWPDVLGWTVIMPSTVFLFLALYWAARRVFGLLLLQRQSAGRSNS